MLVLILWLSILKRKMGCSGIGRAGRKAERYFRCKWLWGCATSLNSCSEKLVHASLINAH